MAGIKKRSLNVDVKMVSACISGFVILLLRFSCNVYHYIHLFFNRLKTIDICIIIHHYLLHSFIHC